MASAKDQAGDNRKLILEAGKAKHLIATVGEESNHVPRDRERDWRTVC